jgi:hypothetical protein
MGIRVEFKDGIQGEVPEMVLDKLIEMGLISRFERQSGWAKLGRDPIRNRPPVISLPERRASMQSLFDTRARLPINN